MKSNSESVEQTIQEWAQLYEKVQDTVKLACAVTVAAVVDGWVEMDQKTE